MLNKIAHHANSNISIASAIVGWAQQVNAERGMHVVSLGVFCKAPNLKKETLILVS